MPSDYLEQISEAAEFHALIIGGVNFLTGNADPIIALADAPEPTVYIRTTPGAPGIYLKNGPTVTNWALPPASVGGLIPFLRADGSPDNIAIVSGEIPFARANGSLDSIALI